MKTKANEMEKVNETPATEILLQTSPEVVELRQQVQELTDKLSKIPQGFNERLDYFNRKQELIKRLRTIDNYREQIGSHIEKISEAAEADEFTSEEFTLSVRKKGTYRDEDDLIKIKQPAIIKEVVSFVLSKIEAKRIELQNLIEA